MIRIPPPGQMYLLAMARSRRIVAAAERQVEMDQKPSIGRVVHYVMPEQLGIKESAVGQHRPALVVRVWADEGHYLDEPGVVQLQVLTDGSNDMTTQERVLWATSVHYDPAGAPGTWHWPERV